MPFAALQLKAKLRVPGFSIGSEWTPIGSRALLTPQPHCQGRERIRQIADSDTRNAWSEERHVW